MALSPHRQIRYPEGGRNDRNDGHPSPGFDLRGPPCHFFGIRNVVVGIQSLIGSAYPLRTTQYLTCLGPIWSSGRYGRDFVNPLPVKPWIRSKPYFLMASPLSLSGGTFSMARRT